MDSIEEYEDTRIVKINPLEEKPSTSPAARPSGSEVPAPVKRRVGQRGKDKKPRKKPKMTKAFLDNSAAGRVVKRKNDKKRKPLYAKRDEFVEKTKKLFKDKIMKMDDNLPVFEEVFREFDPQLQTPASEQVKQDRSGAYEGTVAVNKNMNSENTIITAPQKEKYEALGEMLVKNEISQHGVESIQYQGERVQNGIVFI